MGADLYHMSRSWRPPAEPTCPFTIGMVFKGLPSYPDTELTLVDYKWCNDVGEYHWQLKLLSPPDTLVTITTNKSGQDWSNHQKDADILAKHTHTLNEDDLPPLLYAYLKLIGKA